MKNENAPSDPLRGLGRKKLRNLARKNKIKNAHLKSPAALRRAIRRAEKRKQEIGPVQTKVKSPAEIMAERQKAELEAYQEHRLRYLYAPSRFAHTGTHEEYLLEKDEELNLPDFYEENQLRLLPVDPWQYYLYWDFDTVTLEKVKKYLAEEAVFVLRSYDITSIAFDGSNAHGSWDAVCHPLVREWYISSPVHDRHVCVELGILTGKDEFSPILRSNTTYIPPAGVSPIRRDLFAQFIPQAIAASLPSVSEAIQSPPAQAQSPESETPSQQQANLAEAFFMPFIPTPHLLNPRPEPQRVLDYSTVPRFIPQNIVPVSQVQVPAPQAGRQQPLLEAELPLAPLFESENPITATEPNEPGQSETTWQHREARWSEQLDAEQAQSAGRESIRQTLGIPQGTEIRWFSELPSELTPMIFEQWITDPYDQAMFVSYSIWPWEMTEYLPLGASDWAQRKFLGASLFSWFRPAGSERMVRWQQFPGGSEGLRWLRPVGASERAWSGTHQPPGQREGSVWHLWPERPLNYSGRGLFA